MMGFYLFVLAGTLAMILCLIYLGRIYNISAYKCALIAVLMTTIGYIGSVLMHFVESGEWNGRSLFGGIFLMPVLLYPAARVLNIKYGQLMDVCTPSGCIMLMLMKVKCSIDGCCFGRICYIGNHAIIFPSQKVEALAFLLIGIVLFILTVLRKHEGYIYSYFMTIYGISRFILNLFRETTPWVLGMAPGNFWSLVALIIGIGLIINMKRKKSTIIGK